MAEGCISAPNVYITPMRKVSVRITPNAPLAAIFRSAQQHNETNEELTKCRPLNLLPS